MRTIRLLCAVIAIVEIVAVIICTYFTNKINDIQEKHLEQIEVVATASFNYGSCVAYYDIFSRKNVEWRVK